MLTKPLPEHLVCLPVVKDFMASLGVNHTENIEKDTETYSAKNTTGEIIGHSADKCETDNKFLTTAEAEQVIGDFARQIMSVNHIERRIVIHIITEDTAAKSEQKKDAKNKRQEALCNRMKRVYHFITEHLEDGLCHKAVTNK